ncbi:MAG: SH3 domain-containing protein [Saprospiraceae bacterium]
MYLTKNLIFVGVALLFALACTNNAPSGTTATTAPVPGADTPPPSAKPEVYLYVNKVDKLNLRDQPNKGGQVITQLKEGEFVESQGEKSANKEMAVLRGIEWNEPYYKVTTTTPQQQTGWAYGGALKPVYSGPRNTSPDLGKLTPFSMYLTGLDTKKLESGKQAWSYVTANFGDTKGTLADAAFLLLQQFLFRMETEGEYYKMTEKVKWAEDDYQAIAGKTYDLTKNPVTKTLLDNGFVLEVGEGMIFPIVDWKRLRNFFQDKVTPPMKNYLQQTEVENSKNAYGDGGFVIPMNEIADRAVFWEKFNRDHPYFVLQEETQNSELWMRHSLTNGADNTPVFDYETKQVLPEFSQMWQYVLQQYPGTEAAKRVKEFSELVAAEGGKRSQKVENQQQKYNDELMQ